VPGIGPRRSAGARRLTAATLADTIGETPLPSGPAPATSEPPKKATEWESAPSGYLRSCRSRFSSVSSRDSASSPGSPGEKTVPFCAMWKGIFANHPQLPSSPAPPSGSVPICATWMVTSSRNPFLSRVGPSVQRRPTPPLESPCNVSVPVCATWVGTSSRPSLPSSPSYPLTYPEVDPSDEESTPPREPRRAVRPCPAPRLTSRDMRRALQPTVPFPLRPTVPFPLRSTVPLSPATHCPTSPRPTSPLPLRLPI
jgi:hypothetical protein